MEFNGKKVLIVATTDNMIWQFLIPHIKHLESLGAKVECVCSKTGFWFDELKDKFGFVMHEIPFERSPFKLKNIKCYKQLKKLQKENQYDLIYCQQPVGEFMGALLGRKFHIPVINTAHGFHFFKGCSLKNKILIKTAETWMSRFETALITINDEDFEAAKKMHAKHVYKINGIGFDENKYEPTKETKSEIRKSLGVADTDFVVCTVAEFIKRKNYPTLLNAIAEAKKTNKNIKLLVCGRGKLEQEIKALINKLNIQDNVLLLGYRKDINRVLLASDVFTIASIHEGLTLSVIEAMSFGLPCVVSNVRGNKDLIDEGKGGFCVSTFDHVAFANKIKYFIENPEQLNKMGNYNKVQSKKYTLDAVKKELEKIYKEI